MRRCTEDFRFAVDKKENPTARAENGAECNPVADVQTENGEHVLEVMQEAGSVNDASPTGPTVEASRGSVLVFKPREPGRRMLDRRRMDHRRFLKKILAAIMGS